MGGRGECVYEREKDREYPRFIGRVVTLCFTEQRKKI